MAGSMVRAGFARKEVRRALLAHNAKHCHPPLPEEEVRATALRSVKRWREGEDR